MDLEIACLRFIVFLQEKVGEEKKKVKNDGEKRKAKIKMENSN